MPKILAIDDKMDNLVTLSALLANLMRDCAVITAQSGQEGIAKAKVELPAPFRPFDKLRTKRADMTNSR